MSDLEVIMDGELMVAQVEGLTEVGVDFLDEYTPSFEYTVVDSGRLIVPQVNLPELLAAATQAGLSSEPRS